MFGDISDSTLENKIAFILGLMADSFVLKRIIQQTVPQ